MIIKAWTQKTPFSVVDYDRLETKSTVQAAAWYAKKIAASHRHGGELVDCQNPQKVWNLAEKMAAVL